MTNVIMILFYDEGIKGGIKREIRHNAEANNRYMHGNDKLKKVNFFNLDFNNMNGYALSQPLSYGELISCGIIFITVYI